MIKIRVTSLKPKWAIHAPQTIQINRKTKQIVCELSDGNWQVETYPTMARLEQEIAYCYNWRSAGGDGYIRMVEHG